MLNKKFAAKFFAAILIVAPIAYAMEQPEINKIHPWFTKPSIPKFHGKILKITNGHNAITLPEDLMAFSPVLMNEYEETPGVTERICKSKELACIYHLLNALRQCKQGSYSVAEVIDELKSMSEEEFSIVQQLLQDLDVKLPAHVALFMKLKSICDRIDTMSSEQELQNALDEINEEIAKAAQATALIGNCFVCHTGYPSNEFIKTGCKNPETQKSLRFHSACYQQWRIDNADKCPGCEQENCQPKAGNLIEKWVIKLILDHDYDFFLELLPSYKYTSLRRNDEPKHFNPDDVRPSKETIVAHLTNNHRQIEIFNNKTHLAFPKLSSHNGKITKSSFSPDGEKLLSFSCADGTANIWKLKNQEPSEPLKPYRSLTVKRSENEFQRNFACWHPSGKLVAFLDPKNNIIIYNIENNKILKEIKTAGKPSGVHFNTKGSAIIYHHRCHGDNPFVGQYDIKLPKLSPKQLLYLLMLEKLQHIENPQLEASQLHTNIHISLNDVAQKGFLEKIIERYQKHLMQLLDNS